ncbi:MAG: class II fumarate hydratase [Desulfobacterales bacterium]|nr:class II fumarate hydratase [Desulfobacterales bacterium]
MNFRTEYDSMGSVKVPEDAYYGAQTFRASENFKISQLRLQDEFISAVALIKKCAAQTHLELGLLDQKIVEAIKKAADEIIDGKLQDQFIVDLFQTGSGTSANMNVNEVIAGRANEILTGKRGGKSPVHPNDHVNLGQSSNDVIPSAINIAALKLISAKLVPSLEQLCVALLQKSFEFKSIKKIGRTHLQDAIPLTLGDEFSGYARQIKLGIERIKRVKNHLAELALGGTAVGTGINTHPEFAQKTIGLISKEMNISFFEAVNHFEAQAARDSAVETSGALKSVAVSLIKISNDIRWLASGPRCGLGEITIPSLQPGSSMMPGKINPVMAEAVIQVAFQVIGNDTVITMAGQSGNFELNVSLPVMAYNLIQSINLAARASKHLAERCIEGVRANHKQCESNIEKSLAMATYLVPEIGYDQAATIAKTAFDSEKTIREVALEENIVSKEVLERLLS